MKKNSNLEIQKTATTTSSTARNFFCTLNNPASFFSSTEPEDIVNEAGNKWYNANVNNHSCLVNYEIGENGTPHLHLLLHSKEKIRASAVKKIFPTAHIQIARDKSNCMNYMQKQDSNFKNAGQVIVSLKGFGNTSPFFGKSASKHFLEHLFQQGFGPNEIITTHPQFAKSSNVIHNLYVNYQKETLKNNPPLTVYVEWHYGESFTGKTDSVDKIICDSDAQSVFRVNTLSLQAFDNYENEKLLFIDNYDNQLEPDRFLNIISDGYSEISVRYHNIYKQWSSVYITSIMSPEDAYLKLKKKYPHSSISFKQILNRLDKIIFHSVENGNYIQQEMDKEEYLK